MVPDAFAENDNIGVLNGDVSGGTVDADVDAIEAIAAARARSRRSCETDRAVTCHGGS
jgi:hypothetical protein